MWHVENHNRKIAVISCYHLKNSNNKPGELLLYRKLITFKETAVLNNTAFQNFQTDSFLFLTFLSLEINKSLLRNYGVFTSIKVKENKA